MTGALSYLVFTSLKNRLTTRLRRLKQPKYLAGAIVGGLYMFYFIGLQFFVGSGRVKQTDSMGFSPENLVLYESIGAAILFVVLLLAWVIPRERAALVFSEAEIAFLFPAPVGRRTLIHYKLLKSQIGILFTILIFTIVFARASAGGSAWIRALGWWFILSIVNLHLLGSSFARTILLEQGISTWKRRVVVLGSVAIAAIVVIVWVVRTVPPPDVGGFAKLEDLKYYCEEALKSGPLPYLLYPFRLVIKPYLTVGALPFLLAAGPALLLLGLHYWWVLRSNVAFEEASVDASRKLADRIAAIRENRGHYTQKPKKAKRPPFQLRPTGLPAVGLLWKNLIGAGQVFSVRFWFMCAWMAFIGVMITTTSRRAMDFGQIAAIICAMLFFMSILMGPHLIRQDFRQDLPMADVLKMYPMTGWQMALGEMLAPAAILTGVQWLLIVVSAGLLGSFGKVEIPMELRLVVAAGLALMAPALNMVSLLIPNVAVLMFPGWFQTGKEAQQGFEVMGQRMIFGIAQFIVLILGVLLPACVAFLVVFLLAQLILPVSVAILLGSVAATVVMAVEAWLGLLWLGRLFDRFDLSAETGS